MIKIEAITLEDAYKNAASSLECSVTELKIEVIQYPKKGMFGLFQKNAIIVATKEIKHSVSKVEKIAKETIETSKKRVEQPKKESVIKIKKEEVHTQTIFNDTIMPASFVSTQDDEHHEYEENNELQEDFENEIEEEIHIDIEKIVQNVKVDINDLFQSICFDIEEIEVSAYDNTTLLIEFKGGDAALLIGKEGYRYKALSYMIFNWINAKYQVQLRLEIAEFLKNQEEAVSRYLTSVAENVERDGRAQTKILDGVLVQIALKELRSMYPDKYVVIRSTRDGLKYIIINDYHN